MSKKIEPVLLESKILLEENKKFLLRVYGPDNYRAAVISHYVHSC